MQDMIIYVKDFTKMSSYLKKNHPELLARDDKGQIMEPVQLTGFDRTPAKMKGKALMVYVRISQEVWEKWSSVPGMEVLAQADFDGEGTTDAVYGALFDDEAATAKYESVYPTGPITEQDESGEEYTVIPSTRFGALAGG